MSIFSPKNRANEGPIFGGMIDIHNHCLPGVDDGSKSLEASLEILNGLKEQGFAAAILTPHYVNGTSWASPLVKNREIFEELKGQSPIDLYLGNEIYIDRNIFSLLERNLISPLADSHYLLIELPMSGEFDGYEDIFDELRLQGYQVILAHPERYHSSHSDFSILERLAEDGVLFQCNYGSFIGQYGKNSQKIAKKLAKNQLIFTLGTDIHHVRDYSEIQTSLSVLAKYYSSDELEELTTKNPELILQDRNK